MMERGIGEELELPRSQRLREGLARQESLVVRLHEASGGRVIDLPERRYPRTSTCDHERAPKHGHLRRSRGCRARYHRPTGTARVVGDRRTLHEGVIPVVDQQGEPDSEHRQVRSRANELRPPRRIESTRPPVTQPTRRVRPCCPINPHPGHPDLKTPESWGNSAFYSNPPPITPHPRCHIQHTRKPDPIHSVPSLRYRASPYPTPPSNPLSEEENPPPSPRPDGFLPTHPRCA